MIIKKLDNKEIERKRNEILSEMKNKFLSKSFAIYSIALLLDTSGSMFGNKIEDAKKALIHFIEDINLDKSEVVVVSFGGEVKISDLSNNYLYLKKYIESFSANGDTLMFGAIKNTYEQCLKRKLNSTMVLATDGAPTDGAKEEILKYAKMMKSKGVRIITIAIGEDADREFLKKISSSISDNYFAKKSEDIKQIFDNIKDSLALPSKKE